MVNGFNIDDYNSAMNLEDKDWTDWHSKNTIIFASLLEDGWDWGRDKWTAYTIEPEVLEIVRIRINQKIEDQFFFRELGVLPPKKFAHILVREISNKMAALGPTYNLLAQKNDFSVKLTESTKEKNIHSEYPQAMLDNKLNDYASHGDASQNEKSAKIGPLELLGAFNGFEEPDIKLLDHLDTRCFSNLVGRNF